MNALQHNFPKIIIYIISILFLDILPWNGLPRASDDCVVARGNKLDLTELTVFHYSRSSPCTCTSQIPVGATVSLGAYLPSVNWTARDGKLLEYDALWKRNSFYFY